MRKIIFLFLGTFGIVLASNAQVSNTTDRPGQAMSARTIAADNLQYATGGEFQNWKNTLSDNSKFASTLWDNVFRYGIGQGSEVGLGFQVFSNQTDLNDSIFLSRGLGRLSFKFRHGILLKSSRFTALAYEVDLGVPIQNEISNNKHFSPKLTLSSEINISEKFNGVVNLGMLWDGVSAEQTHFYVLNLGYRISNRWSAFAEYYASYQNGIYDGRWDAGFAFQQNGLCQIDLSGGYDSKSANQHQWFIAIGVSWLKPHSRDILD